jgi:hypothetical protein
MIEDYPVYFKWKTFISYLLDLSIKYPKIVRFNMVDRITNISLDVLELIVEAIYTKDKKIILNDINLKLETLRALFQLSHEKQYISMKQYEFISKYVNETGKMIGGWVKV